MKLLNKYWAFIVVFLVSLVPVIPLLHVGLPITHDGQDHVARIANFYLSLSQGNLIPRWAENLNWGYGHPILMFLYPLPSYIASTFYTLGFSFVDSFKIVMGISFVLSGVAMYLWLAEFVGEIPASIGVLLYNFAPYRFIDFYVRGDIGEQVAFIFPPLVLYFLLKCSKQKTFNRFYFSGAAFSIAGLILAHNAMSLMFLPFITLYGVYLIYLSKNRAQLLYQFVGVLILGFALSAFFWTPALIEGKYTLRDIVTGSVALSRFVNLKDLFYGFWSYGQTGQFSVQLGILNWVFVLAFPFAISAGFKKEKKDLPLYLILYIYLIVSLFIMLPQSAVVWKTITTLQKFQFPWRFLATALFASAVIGALFIQKLPKKLHVGILILTILCIFIFERTYWQPKGYQIKPESFYSGIYAGTTDTGESSPIWSIRSMDKYPKGPAEVIKGTADIYQTFRSSTHHEYKITSNGRSRILENTLYFPGWKIYIDGTSYSGVQFQDPVYRGLMTYYIPTGTHIVDVEFKDTKLRTISQLVSLGALAAIIGLFLTRLTIPGKKS